MTSRHLVLFCLSLVSLAPSCSVAWKVQSGPDMLAANTTDDGDGVEGDADLCPLGREDRDGVQDDDGCPDNDNDGDGWVDSRDRCPTEVGGDAFVVDSPDGCRVRVDSDGDGLFDEDDRCPRVPENLNGFRDDDGCPDHKVAVTEKRVEFEGTVFFKTGSAEIDEVSFDLLKALAEVLVEHPELVLVEVGGHTDDVGSAKDNRKLSQARADSVKAQLVAFGVQAERLSAKGYGEDKPIIADITEEARAANRRVELLILKRNAVAPKPGGAGEAPILQRP